MKRMVYVGAWMVLGFLLAAIAHGVLEMLYINYQFSQGVIPENQGTVFGEGYCALPIWLQWLLWIGGPVAGFFLGRFFWRVIYIEHRYRGLKS